MKLRLPLYEPQFSTTPHCLRHSIVSWSFVWKRFKEKAFKSKEQFKTTNHSTLLYKRLTSWSYKNLSVRTEECWSKILTGISKFILLFLSSNRSGRNLSLTNRPRDGLNYAAPFVWSYNSQNSNIIRKDIQTNMCWLYWLWRGFQAVWILAEYVKVWGVAERKHTNKIIFGGASLGRITYNYKRQILWKIWQDLESTFLCVCRLPAVYYSFASSIFCSSCFRFLKAIPTCNSSVKWCLF